MSNPTQAEPQSHFPPPRASSRRLVVAQQHPEQSLRHNPKRSRSRWNLKRWLRRGISWLPASLRHALMRRGACFPAAILADCEVRRVDSMAELQQTYALVHDAYVAQGWLAAQPSGLWRSSHHELPEATVLALMVAGRCVGTVTLIEDSAAGLPMEDTFPEQVNALRQAPGVKLVEVVSLAVDPAYRHGGHALVLMCGMWRYANHVLGASHMLTVVSAGIADLYRALFDFCVVTPSRHYGGIPEEQQPIDEDPVLGLRQDMGTLPAFARRAWSAPSAVRFNGRSLGLAPFPAAHEHFLANEETIDDPLSWVA